MADGYHHLTYESRCQIYALRESGLSFGALGGNSGYRRQRSAVRFVETVASVVIATSRRTASRWHDAEKYRRDRARRQQHCGQRLRRNWACNRAHNRLPVVFRPKAWSLSVRPGFTIMCGRTGSPVGHCSAIFAAGVLPTS